MDEDEDYSYYEKPRLRLASGPVTREGDGDEGEASPAVKAISCSIGVAMIALGVMSSGIPQFFAFWFALAFLVGPFSPVRITGGDCRVGVGEQLDFSKEEEEDALAAAALTTKVTSSSKSSNASKPPQVPAIKDRSSLPASTKATTAKLTLPTAGKGDWSRAEWDQLRKLLVKFPRGTPQRWEAVARGLGTKRSTEEVSAVAKFMAECTDKDPFAAFQTQAQAASSAAASSATVAAAAAVPTTAPASGKLDTQAGAAKGGAGSGTWTAAQERALLLAVKEFPKDTPQRWDRVAEAVPGRSKAECFRRFSELRDIFKAKRTVEGVATADTGLAEALQEP